MHTDRPACQHVDGGFPLLDEHGSCNPLIEREGAAIIDVHRHGSTPEMHLPAGSGPARLAFQGHADLTFSLAAMSGRTPADDLDVDVVEADAVERLVGLVEACAQPRAVLLQARITLEG